LAEILKTLIRTKLDEITTHYNQANLIEENPFSVKLNFLKIIPLVFFCVPVLVSRKKSGAFIRPFSSIFLWFWENSREKMFSQKDDT